jgi:hypothetical protein
VTTTDPPDSAAPAQPAASAVPENSVATVGARITSPWAIFSTGSTGAALLARTWNGTTTDDFTIPGSFFGGSHRYRIAWGASQIDYFIDGVLVHSSTVPIAGAMRPAMGDFVSGGPVLTVNWARLAPYAAAGSFTSRVFTSGGSSTWVQAVWSSTVPAGTALAISVRTGNSPTPDGSWTAFSPLAGSGAPIGAQSYYIQYRADLSTTDTAITPALADLTIQCVAAPDVNPPAISSIVATPEAGGTTATITWSTDEPASSRVDYGPGGGALAQSVSSGALVTSHSLQLTGLTPLSAYDYRVTSADAATNAATSPASPADPLDFTTLSAVCPSDQTAAHFGAGTTGANTIVVADGDGGVTLRPATFQDWSGSTLPAGWTSATWTGSGTTVVGGGLLSVNGAHVYSTAGFGPGSAIEFVATFHNDPFENIGFTLNAAFDAPWITVGVPSGGGGLYARSSQGTNTLISTTLFDAPHRYRIEWNATDFKFYVDGSTTAAATIAFTVGGSLLAHVSDFNLNGAVLTVDELRILPYAASGTFVSRVIDGGAPTNWATLSWAALTPAGTSLALSARAGNTSVPDGSWSAYAPVASSGGVLGACGRYVQYAAALATTAGSVTPTLESVSFTCSPSAGPGAAVTDLAIHNGTGNDTSGRLKLALTWSGGGPGTTKVFRKAFGDYPAYRTTVGAQATAPASPGDALAAGWTLTAISASGDTDQPPTRDYWSYVLFRTDACGTSTAASNLASAPGYLLGDVSDGVTTCQGNNVVNGADLSFLGAHYGIALSGPADPYACLDIAPTSNFLPSGLPQPDASLDFEDLVVMALAYSGSPGPASPGSRPGIGERSLSAAAANAARVVATTTAAVGETFDVSIVGAGAGDLVALSLALGYDAAVVEPLAVEPGELLELQAAPSIVLSPQPGRVDVALLGADARLVGEGELARVRFRVRAAGDPAIALRSAEGRDGSNRTVDLAGLAAPPDRSGAPPERTELVSAYPNPFARRVSFDLALRAAGPVRLGVYDVLGRRVRMLADGVEPAGRRTVVWDGRNDAGRAVASGAYWVRFEAGSVRQTRSVLLVR